MDLAGEILKKRREELGRDIQEIADLLKIRADCIRAIEEDAFEKLPAPVYTLGYIRCYARYLGIDADPIVEYYSKNLSQPRASTIIPIAFSQKKSPLISYAIVVLLGVVAALFLAVYFRQRPAGNAAVAPVKPETVEAAPAAPAATSSAPASPPLTSAPAAAQTEAGTHTLSVTASRTTWMLLRFSGGKTEELMMKPGESRNWSFADSLSMKVGNAGGIRISLDGKDLGAPGLPGQVLTLELPPH